MQYLVHDLMHDSFIGPFPSQCQAMSYCEKMNKHHKAQGRFIHRRLETPAFMPEQIHD